MPAEVAVETKSVTQEDGGSNCCEFFDLFHTEGVEAATQTAEEIKLEPAVAIDQKDSSTTAEKSKEETIKIEETDKQKEEQKIEEVGGPHLQTVESVIIEPRAAVVAGVAGYTEFAGPLTTASCFRLECSSDVTQNANTSHVTEGQESSELMENQKQDLFLRSY